MKNKELFYKSVNILQKAYFNGTLSHGNPCGCAVGNLITGNNCIMVDDTNSAFNSIVKDSPYNWINKLKSTKESRPDGYDEETAIKQLESTGYSFTELLRIESSFEGIRKIIFDEDGFKSLCAVLDVLMEIHEFNREEIKLPDNTKIFNKEELVLIQE